MHKILVNVMREEIRMAVIDEKEQLIDFVLERTDESHMANHMYKGTVKNVLNGMQAAFVDIGGSQNAYLNLQQGKEQKILPRLSVGQQILVQVVKEEMLGKGARVTADVSLAGRFMVLYCPILKACIFQKRLPMNLSVLNYKSWQRLM